MPRVPSLSTTDTRYLLRWDFESKSGPYNIPPPIFATKYFFNPTAKEISNTGLVYNEPTELLEDKDYVNKFKLVK